MKDLEDIYNENYLFPDKKRETHYSPRNKVQKIEKIQGMFNSILLELDKLKDDFDPSSDAENGFYQTLEDIANKIYTPGVIFDRTFFENRNKL